MGEAPEAGAPHTSDPACMAAAGIGGAEGVHGPGGQQGAASAAAAAERQRHVQAICALDRRLLLLCTLINCMLHSGHSRRFVPVILGALLWVLATVRPAAYATWRQPLLLAFRVTCGALPFLPTKVPRPLEAPPSLGPRGLVQDLSKLVWGSGLVVAAVSALLAPLPLLPHLVAQLGGLAAFGRHRHSLCRAPMLAHPNASRRIGAFHSAMHLLSVAVGTGPYTSAALAHGEQEQQCGSYLMFVAMMLGLVLPTVLLAKVDRLLEPCWQAVGSSSSGGGRSGGGSTNGSGGGGFAGGGGGGGGDGGAAGGGGFAGGGRRCMCIAHALKLLSGRSWLPAALCHGGLHSQQQLQQLLLEAEGEGNMGWAGSTFLSALSWWLLLCYCYALSIAVG